MKLREINRVGMLGLGPVAGMLKKEFPERLEEVWLVGKSGQGDDFEEVEGVRFTEDVRDALAEIDVLVVAVANNTLERTLAEIAEKMLADREPPTVVLLQNGVAATEVAKNAFENEAVNLVRLLIFTTVVDGDYDEKKLRASVANIRSEEDAVEAVARLMEESGFAVERRDEVKRMEWTKLWLNLFGSSGAVTGLGIKETLSDKELMKLEMGAMRDRLAIMEEVGMDPMTFEAFNNKVGHLMKLIKIPVEVLGLPVVRHLIGRAAAGERGDRPPSAAVKMGQGRKTEVRWYHGPFVEMSRKRWVEARSPVDEAILEIVGEHDDPSNEFTLAGLGGAARKKILLERVAKLDD